MSYEKAQWINPSEKEPVFSGGLVDNAFENQLGNNQSPYLRNVRLDGYGAKIRPGHSLFATLTAGSYPKGIGTYLRATPANDRLVVRHNTDATHKLYTIDSSANLTSIVTGANISSDNRMWFQNGKDVIYCMNGSDLFAKLNGTTYSTITANVPASFAPSFSVIFNGSHWASGWSTNPNTVYKSVGENFEDFSSSGSDSLNMSEPVTGLSANNETLFYFTKNTVSATTVSDIIDVSGTLTYITRAIQVKEGSINHFGVVGVGNFVYYVTPSRKIVQLRRGQNIDGFEVQELSHRKFRGIEKLMNSLDEDQTDCFGYFYQPANLIKWHFKSAGSTFNDVCVVYDIEKDVFFIDTQKYFFGGVMFDGKAYTISMIEPKVYEDEVNQDDEDSPIDFEYRTKEFDLGEPTRKKLLWETRTFCQINELAELTQEIYINGVLADTKTIDIDNIEQVIGGIGSIPIGEFAIGDELDNTDEMSDVTILRTKGNLNVKGKKVQFRYTCNTLAAKALLLDIKIKLELLPELATDLTL